MTGKLEKELSAEEDRRLNLPFDQYQRYRDVKEVVECIRGHSESLRLLDVGGGEAQYLPAPNFFPRDFVVVADLHPLGLPHYIRADGTCLPFKNDAFDIAFSCDTLEHIPPERRKQFVSELFRVSRSFVILVAPFRSPIAELAEDFVQQVYTSECREPNKALLEHKENGLPELVETEAIVRSLSTSHLRFPSGNIHNWVIMNCIAFTFGSLSVDLYRAANQIYNRYFYWNDHYLPAYRNCFVAAKTTQAHLQFDRLKKLLGEWIAPRKNNSSDLNALNEGSADIPHVQTWMHALQCVKQVVNERDLHIRNLDLHIRNLEESGSNMDRAVRELTRFVEDRDARIEALVTENQNLQERVTERDQVARDLQLQWNLLHSSRAWRALRQYYRLRERMLPQGSHRRAAVRVLWRLATRLRPSFPRRRWHDL
jgi:hypothetical protein